MKRTIISLALATTLGAALTACSSGAHGSAAPAASTKPAVTPSASSPASVAPTPRPAPTPTVTTQRLGTSGKITDRDENGTFLGYATVTAYAYKQPVARSAPKPDQAGYVWAAVDVKVCVPENSTISSDPWSLIYPDDTSAQASSTGYNQFPLPEYAWGDVDLNKGRCHRGWIVYPVPANQRPVMVEYSAPSTGQTVDWSVPR